MISSRARKVGYRLHNAIAGSDRYGIFSFEVSTCGRIIILIVFPRQNVPIGTIMNSIK